MNYVSALQQCVGHDHSYSGLPDSSKANTSTNDEMSFVRQNMADHLYRNHICLSPEACIQVVKQVHECSCVLNSGSMKGS